MRFFKFLQRRGLTLKFFVYFVFIFILPLIGISYLAYVNGRQAIINGTLDNLSSTLVLRESEIERWLFDTVLGFEDTQKIHSFGDKFEEVLTFHPPRKGKELSIYAPPPRHDELHRSVIKDLKNIGVLTALNFFELFLLTKNGEVHISTDPDQELKHKEDRLYYQEGLQKTTLQPFYYSVTLKEPAVTVSTPVRDDNNRIVGVLAGRLRLDRLSRIMEERTGLGNSGETYLVNDFHFLVSRSRYGYSLGKGIFTKGIDDCLKNRQSGASLYENYEGTPVIGAYRFIEKYNVCMIAEISQEEALEPIQNFRNATLLFGSSALFVVCLFGFFAARSLIRPIRILQKGAQEIGRGNLDYTFTVGTRDELDDLAKEFDTMRVRLQEVRSREENLSKLKSEFVSLTAHQMRTPLSGMKWAIDALIKEEFGTLSARQKDFLAKTYQNNERMITLIGDFLDIAKIEEGKFGYKMEKADIEKILFDVLAEKKELAKKRNISLEYKNVTKNPLIIFADPQKLGIALTNIVDNAIVYTRGKGKIILTLEADKNNARIRVHDTGIGISDREKPRLFSKFFRGVEAVKMDTVGSGFGLYIAKNIIEYHKGRIEVESEEHKGSTFTVILPRAESEGSPS